MQVVVEIPNGVVDRLLPEGVDRARMLLEDRTAQAYREGLLTTEDVRQTLGFATRFDVEPFLRKYEIFDYTPEMLEKDLQTLERLHG